MPPTDAGPAPDTARNAPNRPAETATRDQPTAQVDQSAHGVGEHDRRQQDTVGVIEVGADERLAEDHGAAGHERERRPSPADCDRSRVEHGGDRGEGSIRRGDAAAEPDLDLELDRDHEREQRIDPGRGDAGGMRPRDHANALCAGQASLHRKPTARRRPDVHVPAVQRRALAHPGDPVSTRLTVVGVATATGVGDLHLDRVARPAYPDSRAGGPGVLDRVRQRLLHDPVRAQVERRRHGARLAGTRNVVERPAAHARATRPSTSASPG